MKKAPRFIEILKSYLRLPWPGQSKCFHSLTRSAGHMFHTHALWLPRLNDVNETPTIPSMDKN